MRKINVIVSSIMSGDNTSSVTEIQKETHLANTRLENWSKWQKEWQKVQTQIGQKLNVEPGDLVENFSEGVRSINEEKEVLQYAKIPTEFDKYRGKPDFYELPNALFKKHPCYYQTVVKTCCGSEKCQCCGIKTLKLKCSLEPTYFAVKSKQESYVVPEIELVGIPEAIRQEKNVLNGARNIYKRWKDCKYRQQQMEKLADKIAHIVPHWPEFDHLVVLGSTLIPHSINEDLESKQDVEERGTLKSTESEKTSTDCETPSLLQERRLGIEINGISFDDRESRTVRLFFEYDLSSDDIISNFLQLKNTGLCTIKVSWEKIDNFRLFRDITEEPSEKFGFYFDRKEMIILPHQTVDFPVWFKTDTPGTLSENWKLITRPKIHSKNSLILTLESYSYFKDLREKINKIVEYIDNRAKIKLIQDILSDIVDEVKHEEHVVDPCVFDDAHIFEIANLINDRPQFLYNETFIEELKQIYNTLTTNQTTWDFSVKNLIKLAHHVDTVVYTEKKFAEIAAKIEGHVVELPVKKKSHSKELHDKKHKSKSKDNVVKEKSVVDVKKEPEDIETFEYTNQLQVWNVVKKLDAPVIINSEREKYFACTQIVTCYFNKMCHLLESLENERDLKRESIYPPIKNKLASIDELPERLVYERFENHYVPILTSEEVYTFEVKRKPRNVRHIPSDDIETLYTTYFNKSLTIQEEPKTKKTKEKKKEKPKKSKSKTDKLEKKLKKDKAKEEHPKEEKSSPEISVESFKPYAECFVYNSELEAVEKRHTPPLNQIPGKGENYYYRQYLIIYSCLGNAVDALVDTINSFERVVPHSTLNEVKKQIRRED